MTQSSKLLWQVDWEPPTLLKVISIISGQGPRSYFESGGGGGGEGGGGAG